VSIDTAALEGAPGPSAVTTADAADLQSRLGGTALLPGDPGNATVRPVFNAMHAGTPALVVRCTGTSDVVQAVHFARGLGVPVTVRGGGHSIAGLSAGDGSVLIDLSPMSSATVDPGRRIVRAQGGALWGGVDRETQLFGLATPGGVISDTGIGGLTLGGGYGWLRRRYGLACDNLVEAQVVTADGSVHTASAESEPDLFWAIRGGGGNFGVATSLTYRLHAVGPEVAFAGCFHPAEDVAEILGAWRSFTEEAPDEVSSMIVVLTFPNDPHVPEPVQGRACTVVAGVYAGDAGEGMRALQPLRAIRPIVDISQPMPYTVVQSSLDALFERGSLRSYWKSQYLDTISDGAVGAFAEAALHRPAPLTVVNVWHMGGAINAVAPDGSAFGERSASYLVSIDGNWPEASRDGVCVDWVRSTWASLGRFGNGRSYLNFTGLSDEPATTAVGDSYGPNLARLAAIKGAYDPGNLFSRTNNITPATNPGT
jgi:FAD/FMN-containing dehydrogenase